jgi:hypothetical protein
MAAIKKSRVHPLGSSSDLKNDVKRKVRNFLKRHNSGISQPTGEN